MDSLDPHDFKNSDELENIWNAMISNIGDSNVDLSRTVSKSIQKLTPSSAANFEHPTFRQKVMGAFFDLLKSQDFEILNSAMEGLIKIVEINYKYMGEYL